jgi:hypothetical protein
MLTNIPLFFSFDIRFPYWLKPWNHRSAAIPRLTYASLPVYFPGCDLCHRFIEAGATATVRGWCCRQCPACQIAQAVIKLPLLGQGVKKEVLEMSRSSYWPSFIVRYRRKACRRWAFLSFLATSCQLALQLESLARARCLLLTPSNLPSLLKTLVASLLNHQGGRAVGQDRSPIGPSPYPHPFPTSRLKRQRPVVHASHEPGASQCTCTTLLISSWVRAGWPRAGPLTIDMSAPKAYYWVLCSNCFQFIFWISPSFWVLVRIVVVSSQYHNILIGRKWKTTNT